MQSAPVMERAARLRSVLTENPGSRALLGELLPRHVAEVGHGQDTVLDFSDWSQFSQWPQSY